MPTLKNIGVVAVKADEWVYRMDFLYDGKIEFEIETEDDGYMTFRTFKPFGGEFVWQWADQRPDSYFQ